MLSYQEAKRILNEYLRAEGSPQIAGPAHRDRRWPVWVISARDPERPREMLLGGVFVVTDDGAVYSISSTPAGVDDLMDVLGIQPEPGDVWEREGEGLALLAEIDPEEAAGLAAYAEDLQRQRRERSKKKI